MKKYHYLIPFVLLFFAQQIIAQNCANGWQFYREVTVTNSSSEQYLDYQAYFTLNTVQLAADFKLRDDGADLRVFDAATCTPLPFWGDSLGLSEQSRIWVKLPQLDGNSSVDLQVYYGKSDATSAADGDATFILFDDFDGTEVDADKWEAVGEFDEFSVQNGSLRYASTSMNPGPRFKFARTKMSFSDKVIFDWTGDKSNSNGYGFSSADSLIERILVRDQGMGFDTINLIAVMRDTLNNGFANVTTYPVLRFPRFAFQTHSVTIEVNNDNKLEFTRYENQGTGEVNTDSQVVEQLEMSGFHFILSSFSPSFVITLNNLRVRQHVDVPPTSTVGPELMAPVGVRFVLQDDQVQVFPNPATDFVQLQVATTGEVEVQLLDALGRVLLTEQKSNAEATTISLINIPAGSYTLRLRDAEDGTLLYVRQLVKN